MHTFIGISLSNVKKFVNYWDSSFPLDYYWRQRHNVAFNSEQHRQSCFIDQLFEYLEDEAFQKILKKSIDKKEVYQPGFQNWLKSKKYSEKEVDDIFNSLDLDNL